MTRTTSCAGERAGMRALPAERRLARYHKDFRARIHALARRHPRLTDLAASFPALLFALAAPRRGFQPEGVILRVIEGAPLKTLAGLACVPLWLRKLPPETFTRSLPALPDDAVFRREVANYLPRSFRIAPSWLSAVADAAEWSNDRIACWTAREAALGGRPLSHRELLRVCLWAWFCGQSGTLGYSMCGVLWQPSMRFTTALAVASAWLERLELHLNLGDGEVDDMWLQPGNVAGYSFAPIASAAAIREEAKAMENCIVTLGDFVARGRWRFWSMRRNGERLATVQIGLRHDQPLLQIMHMKRARNAKCSHDEWWAALQWLHGHDLPEVTKRMVIKPGPTTLQRPLWMALWRPYWLAKRRIPDWLPLTPEGETLLDRY
jgi:hypothetical protein